jgi:hypothetical protein
MMTTSTMAAVVVADDKIERFQKKQKKKTIQFFLKETNLFIFISLSLSLSLF